jgi:hypothetical protein
MGVIIVRRRHRSVAEFPGLLGSPLDRPMIGVSVSVRGRVSLVVAGLARSTMQHSIVDLSLLKRQRARGWDGSQAGACVAKMHGLASHKAEARL